jgi:CHASE2 domain-containing sensor protein
MKNSLFFRALRVRIDRLRKKYEAYVRPLLVAFLVTSLFVLYFKDNAISRATSHALTNVIYQIRGALPPPNSVVVVTLNNSSKRELGVPSHRTFPRDVIAQLIESVHKAGASKIFVDLLFVDQAIVESEDPPLERALQNTKAIIGTGRDAVKQPVTKIPYIEGVDPLPKFAEVAGQVIPVTFWTARDYGSVGFISERFGVDSDRIPLIRLFDKADKIWSSPPKESDRIMFYGPPHRIHTLSASEVINEGDAFNSIIKGKAVFIGIDDSFKVSPEKKTGFSYKDMFSVPTSSQKISGVELHATIYSNLHDRSWLRAPFNQESELPNLMALSVVCLWIIFAFRGVYRGLIVIAFGILWVGLAVWGLHNHYFIPGGEYVFLLWPLATVLVTLLEFFIGKLLVRLKW